MLRDVTEERAMEEQLRQAQTHSFASAYLLRVYVAGGAVVVQPGPRR